MLAFLGLKTGKDKEIISHVRGGGTIPDIYNEPGYNMINTKVILHHHNHHLHHHYYYY